MLCITDCLLMSKKCFRVIMFCYCGSGEKKSSVMSLEYVSFDFQPSILSLKVCKDTVITKSCYKGSRAPKFGWIYTMGLDTHIPNSSLLSIFNLFFVFLLLKSDTYLTFAFTSV